MQVTDAVDDDAVTLMRSCDGEATRRSSDLAIGITKSVGTGAVSRRTYASVLVRIR